MFKLYKLIELFELKVKINPYTKMYAMGRSVVALGSLSVLIFNDLGLLFDKDALDVISSSEYFINQINLFGLLGYENLYLSKLISILVLLSVIVGYYPQITGLLHFWIIYSFHNSALLLDGGDQIAIILTFLLTPITILDKRKNHWDSEMNQSFLSKYIGHTLFIIISIQVSFIYFNTAIEKIYLTEEWKNGTALYYIFHNEYFGIWNNIFLLPLSKTKFVFFLSWWVLISHLSLSYLLFLPRTNKRRFIWLGIFLHGGIALLMGLFSFSIIMIGALIIYILPYNSFEKIKTSNT